MGDLTLLGDEIPSVLDHVAPVVPIERIPTHPGFKIGQQVALTHDPRIIGHIVSRSRASDNRHHAGYHVWHWWVRVTDDPTGIHPYGTIISTMDAGRLTDLIDRTAD